MQNRSAFWLVLLFSVLIIIPHICFAHISMGIFPRRDAQSTFSAFKPLAAKIEKELGEPVTLVIPRSFKAFWLALKKQKFDLVHYNPYHYIRSHKEFGYKVILTNEEFGQQQLSSALIVREDSGINTIDDLRGKTILFGGGKKAMASYIGPTVLLQQAGLFAGVDYTERFAKNPLVAVIAVNDGRADASGSGAIVPRLESLVDKIDQSQIKVLATSDLYAHLTWATNKDMPADKTQSIQKIMLQLRETEEGQAILRAAKVTGFNLARDVDFITVRELTKSALGEDY